MTDEVDQRARTADAARDALTIRLIDDATAWDEIREDWNHLHAASPTASTTLDFVWLHRWWQVYGPVYGAGGLRIITLWRGTQMVGALPLYIELRRTGPFVIHCLRLVSTGEAEFEETCPDYLNLLHLPGEAKDCARAAWQAIAQIRWHTLELLDLPNDSPLLDGHEPLHVKVTPRGGCPVAFIGDGFEAYLAQLSSKTRMRARQELRKVESAGVVFELANGTDADRYMDDLVRLHQQRWTTDGKPGCFSAPRFTEFHRLLVQDWIASGRVILARLSYRGEACVVLYGFVTGDKFDLYQLGVGTVEGTSVRSPGTASNLLLMDRLAQQGVSRYDFLRGGSDFKKSLATERRNLICVYGARQDALVWFDRCLRLSWRVIRKIRRIILRSLRIKHQSSTSSS
jgi:CelD/BcsL family acetyltransferase involved in cellulose biosynthesis